MVLYLAVDAKEDDWRIIAKPVLAGYEKRRKAADIEHILISRRLVSSLVYALRTVRINYRNEDPSYILKIQTNGWRVLEVSDWLSGKLKSIFSYSQMNMTQVIAKFDSSITFRMSGLHKKNLFLLPLESSIHQKQLLRKS